MESCQKKTVYDRPDGIEHVIIIGVDGLSPDGIKKAETPFMDSLMAAGSVKWNVRTVLTSASSQNWASMIMGAGPEAHGIIDNDWELDDHSLPPLVQGADGRFPSIFSVLKEQQPNAEIGIAYHWEGFGRLVQPQALSYDAHFSTEDSTAVGFSKYIIDRLPKLAFVHLDHVDHVGHSKGHGSQAYYKAVEKTDSLVRSIYTAIAKAGIQDRSLVIITSDHGGKGFGHGGPTPEEAEIAWIMNGATVKKGYQIEQQVYTYDLAATMAFALGLEPPYAWTGRPVKAAFEGFDEPANLWKGKQLIAAPTIFPKDSLYKQAGGLYIDRAADVSMLAPDSAFSIRYTLDGKEPDTLSALYGKPFELTRTTVVKAKAFDGEGNESSTRTAYFRILKQGLSSGLNTSFYSIAPGKKLPDLDRLVPVARWKSHEFSLERDRLMDLLPAGQASFALRYEGFIAIDTAGKYTFYTASDDGSNLYIDGLKVVDNDGDHGLKESAGDVQLQKGRHAIRLDYFNNIGGFWVDAFYKGPGITKQLIPANILHGK